MAQRVSMFSASRPFWIYRIEKQIAFNMRTDKCIFLSKQHLEFIHSIRTRAVAAAHEPARAELHGPEKSFHQVHFGSVCGSFWTKKIRNRLLLRFAIGICPDANLQINLHVPIDRTPLSWPDEANEGTQCVPIFTRMLQQMLEHPINKHICLFVAPINVYA